jgi:hypothetical protein
MFAPARLLGNWSEQRPSNQGDPDLSVTGEVGRVYYTGVDLLLISFSYRNTWILFGSVLNGTSFTTSFREIVDIFDMRHVRQHYELATKGR